MLKRSFDSVVSGGSLLLLTPVLLCIALLVRVSSPGVVIYRAARIGKGGQPFVMYKFRTMREEGAATASRVTPARDPRVTGVGRWLRDNKLDELPQLWNVLKGEMSLVGTRPQDPRYFAHYTPEQRRVFSVRPGLVSAANVEYVHEEELLAWAGDNFEDYYIRTLLPEKLRVDLAYLERQGFFADLRLLLRAARRVLGRNWAATPELPETPRAAGGGGKAAARPPVSVIIPARNAAGTIGATLDSIRAQDYGGPVEVVIADGSDTGETAAAARRHYPEARIVANPEKTTPHGLNAAIAASAGQVVARCDCYTTLAPDYLRRAVETLERTGAAVVGGRQRPVGDSLLQRAVALAISTPLGAGDARYRLGGPAGPVDNFYLGVYTRDALAAVDGFDPALTRNQDCEFNWRQRRRGELVWFDPELTVYYRPRRSLGALARQYFDYGRWKPVALRKHPREVRARHLAAPLLVLGLAASAGLAVAGFTAWALVLPLVYVAGLLLGSVAVGLRRRDAAAVLLPVAAATMHLSWGIGFFMPARLGRTPLHRAREGDGGDYERAKAERPGSSS